MWKTLPELSTFGFHTSHTEEQDCRSYSWCEEQSREVSCREREEPVVVSYLFWFCIAKKQRCKNVNEALKLRSEFCQNRSLARFTIAQRKSLRQVGKDLNKVEFIWSLKFQVYSRSFKKKKKRHETCIWFICWNWIFHSSTWYKSPNTTSLCKQMNICLLKTSTINMPEQTINLWASYWRTTHHRHQHSYAGFTRSKILTKVKETVCILLV